MFWITGLLGLALLVAPFAFGYQNDQFALWTSVVLGAVMLAASAYKALIHDQRMWEYWIAGIAGVLAIAAPFVFGFSVITTALWTSIVVGAVVAILAGYEVFFVQPATR